MNKAIKLVRGAGTWVVETARRSPLFRGFLIFLLVMAGLSVAAGVGVYFYYVNRASQYDLSELKAMRERTEILDRDGNRLGSVWGHGENRQVIPLENVSPNFIHALLSREDSRFYDHQGVDPIAVIRAAVKNIRAGEIAEGASTLTMQLARNTFGMREQSFDRKLLEAFISARIEREFTKDEILESYVNRIYFGSGMYGIERASQGFFMKPASELTLSEAAMLAGIIRAPSRFSPFRDVEAAVGQRNDTLARMVHERYITKEEEAAAREEPLWLRPPDQRLAPADYALQSVHDELEVYLDQEWIDRGGLRVFTTLDSHLQKKATEALEAHLAEVESQPGFPHPKKGADQVEERLQYTQYLQGAVVSIDNQTGGILAMVGGRDFGDSPYNRATQARRQVGSTFKPFVYAAAFANGLMPGTLVSDDPISMPGGDGKTWSPGNSDGKFLGLQPAGIGLVRSRNTMSIRVGMTAGVENVLAYARALNLGENIPESPVSFIGAFETTPLTLTSAFTVFPNLGERKRPYLIDRIETAEGEVIYQSKVLSHRVFPPSVAWLTADVLGEVMNRGTGASARTLGMEGPIYGKTGTTDDYKDAWFVGFTDKITTGVWVGLDRPQTIMSRGYGSTLALPVWVDLMQTAGAEERFQAQALQSPVELVNVSLCRECSLRASRYTRQAYAISLPQDLVPQGVCQGNHRDSFTQQEEPKRRPAEGLFGKLRRFFGGR